MKRLERVQQGGIRGKFRNRKNISHAEAEGKTA
jgi:hypothetical protein